MIRGAGLLFVVACGCGWNDTASSSERTRGVARGPEDTAVAPATPAAPVDAPAPPPRPPPPPPPPAAPEAPAGPAELEPERDYAAELAALVGSPLDCLQPRKVGDAPEQLSVELEAYVMESGLISRGYVRSSVLGADETNCIRRRLEAQHLAAPVDDAPRQVRATIRFALKTPESPGK